MKTQKYSVNQHLIENILSLVKTGEIAIPESIYEMEIESYDKFLGERRKLVSKKIKKYYYSV